MTITCAIGCLSTSSATNVGEDKDSDKPGGRQAYRLRDHQLVLRCRCLGRPRGIGASGFTTMPDRIDGNGVRTVIVESAERFARKMLTAELGRLLLVTRGVTLKSASGEDRTDTDDEMRVTFWQMAMTFAQLEKTRL